MKRAILTIDDTPSSETGKLTDFLLSRHVPAILFCRGDRLEQNLDAAIHATRKGFVLGNHAYSHTRFSVLSFEQGCDEIRRTEKLIETAYKNAGVARTVKYFRFPHMDRGAGGWVVDYDAAGQHGDALKSLFADGLNINLDPPAPDMVEKKSKLQAFLMSEGFASLPSQGVTFPWFQNTEMKQAVDAMFTFSTSDWMITPRHAGTWPYKKLEDLKRKIDDDRYLGDENSANIILAHDQDGLFPVVSALVDHLLSKGISFYI